MKTVRAEWSTALLVCGKCSKKLGGGFGRKGRTGLAKALRRALSLKKGRKAMLGVVEVKCLGICPKNAVTVVDAAAPRGWTLVPAGMAIDTLVDALGLATREPCTPGAGSHNSE